LPAKLTAGLEDAFDVKVNDADSEPLVVGAKETVTEQVPPAGMLDEHVFVWAKAAALVPLIPT